MRTALNLLNKIVDLGYDQQKVLVSIDKILDKKLGIEGRKPLSDEVLTDIIFEDILGIFQEEAGKSQEGCSASIKKICSGNKGRKRI